MWNLFLRTFLKTCWMVSCSLFSSGGFSLCDTLLLPLLQM